MNEKTIFGIFIISIVTILQVVAWVMGFNSQVFAFTSLIIGLTAGVILGFKFPASE
jgi:hypothetical protein